MKRSFFLILFFFVQLTVCAQRYGKKFTPIYGTDAEINQTLSFVTENLVFDSLTYTRLGNVQGYVRCTFNIDTDGRVVDIKIVKSLAYWLDHEIISAMKRLPATTPLKNKNGDKIKVSRNIYFTFNSTEDKNRPAPPFYGSHTEADPKIAEQRHAIAEKMMAQQEAWDGYMKDNTKISLDGKSIYKPDMLPSNPLKINTPPVKPPINVTIKVE